MKKRDTFFTRYRGVIPASVIIATFMLIPILIIVVYSFMIPNPNGGVRPGFTFFSYQKLLFDHDLFDNVVFSTGYLKIFYRSIWVSVVAVIASLLVGFPVAYYISIQKAERRSFLILLITIPFWTNLLIRTYSWILVLRDTGLVNGFLISTGIINEPITMLYTEGAIILGLVYTYVPFMILPIYASLERLDIRLIEACRDLYTSKWGALRHVVFPLAKPGIIAGCILVFIPSIGAFIAPELLGGGKNLMLGSLVQLQFSSGRNWPFGSALAVIIMMIVMVALLIQAYNARKNGSEIVH